MDIIETIISRKSIRKYDNKTIPEDVLLKILDAGRMANSARNRQEWAFVLVTDPTKIKALVPACRDQQFVGEAGAVIAVCATESEHVMACGMPTYIVDCSIATDHMQLVATSEGLGTCWLGSFYQDEVKKILSIPENIFIVALLTVGYPAEDGRPKTRKKLDEIMHRNEWGGK